MNELKKIVVILIEMFAFLAIGCIFTGNILKHIYESYGIQFLGNVWVNWFGVSYILFVLYTLIVGLFIMKESNLYKQRRTSTFFWLLLIGSSYAVYIPFIKGVNPF